MATITLHALDGDGLLEHLEALAGLLHATVAAGASIHFVLPFDMAQARAFWAERTLPQLRTGARQLWIAELDGRLAGTVQLVLDMPPNQLHRCEVSKLLVHPECRNRGVARRLMAELETRARRLGRRLVTLDTRTGDAAEPLYRSLGYHTAGTIPDFCRATDAERYHATTCMYRIL